MPHYILLHETKSTNSYLKPLAATLPSGTVIHTPCQTAGRGQKGNSWESEPGKNLSFSFLLKGTGLPANKQFHISEACALAVHQALSAITPGFTIKWPNDIYHGDSKICGILIENSLQGSTIAHSVIGIGINVNQEKFVSDAPNPISLKNITGREHNLTDLLHDVCNRIECLCNFASATQSSLASMHNQFMASLYRADGMPHLWQLPSGEQFQATIIDVAPDGMLSLRDSNGQTRTFAFKEVKHIIKNISL